MDWKQIETKWATMVRRIRADADFGKIDESIVVLRRTSKPDLTKTGAGGPAGGGSDDITQKRNSASPH